MAGVSKRDYYEVLGVPRTASLDEIKKAYRRLARQLHPDVNKDDPHAADKFKELTEAYQVLSNEESRRKYDQFGHAAFEQGAGPGGPGGADFSWFEDFPDLSDLFDLFMGGAWRRRATGPQRGADLRYDLTIGFEEAAFGTEKEIEVPRTEICPRCHGNQAEPGTPIRTCPHCHGTGHIQMVQNTFFGRMATTRVCEACGGQGKLVDTPCRECHGQGVVHRQRRLKVRIPAGVDEGTRIRLAGEGEAGSRGGSPGDLYVFVRVKPHKLFVRQGLDIRCQVPITFAQAALGAEIQVPTLEGTMPLRIPEGTQTGSVFRLRGKGIPSLQGFGRGDQFVEVKVVTPTKLNPRQRRLFKELADSFGEEVLDSQGLLGKMKDSFTRHAGQG